MEEIVLEKSVFEEATQTSVDLRNDMQKFFPNNKIIFKLVVNDLDNVVKRIE